MSFDIQGALKAGYSEKEIIDFLSQEGGSDFDVAGARSAGYSDREILDFLNQDAPVSVPEESGLQLEQPEVDLDAMPGYRGTVESTSKAMGNAPRSFMEEAGGIIDAVTNYDETAKNVGRLVAGAGQKAWRGIGGETDGEYIPYADAFADMYAERYGSLDKARKTFEEKPFALLGDATTLLTGGGGTLAAAGKLGKAGNVASKAGKALNTAAKYTDPMTHAAILATPVTAPIKGLAKAVTPSPERLYGSAIKGLSSLPPEVRKGVLDTAFKERILPTEEGLVKLQDIQKNVGKQVGDLVDERATKELAGEAPLTISGPAMIERAKMFVKEREKGPFYKERHKEVDKAARKARKGFYGMMDTRTAHDLKLGAQKAARATYDEANTELPASKLFANALAHEAREAVEKSVPEVAPLNSRLSKLHPLEEVLKRATGRELGNNIITLPAYLGGGMYGLGAGTALNIARLPAVKGKTAFALDSLRKLPESKKAQFFMGAQRPLRSGAYIGNLLDLIAEEDEK
jgi:hypothetical protein